MWNFDYPAAAKTFSNRHCRTLRHDHVPNASQWSHVIAVSDIGMSTKTAHSANWSSNVHQQEVRRTSHEGIEGCGSNSPGRGREHCTRIASGSPLSKRCHRVDSEDVEGTDESDEVCTGEQAAHDGPVLPWIPTFAGDTIARCRKGPDGKTPWEREQGRKWAGDSLEFGERFFMKEAKERASGAVRRDWEPRLIDARYLGQHARTGAIYRRNCLWKAWASIARSRTLGSDRLARSQRSAFGLATNRGGGT